MATKCYENLYGRYKDVHRIFQKCLFISINSEHDIFFYYSPHVDGVSIQIHEGGYVDEFDEKISLSVYNINDKQWDEYEKLLDFEENEINKIYEECI